MPYAIRKVSGGYAVFNTDTGERKNEKPYPSRSAALPYLKALYAHEPAAEKLKKVHPKGKG